MGAEMLKVYWQVVQAWQSGKQLVGGRKWGKARQVSSTSRPDPNPTSLMQKVKPGVVRAGGGVGHGRWWGRGAVGQWQVREGE